MGNRHGFLSAITSTGTNKVVQFDGGFFSFAHGDEIALAIGGSYYIINCDPDLWLDVITKTKQTNDLLELKEWWCEKANSYEISQWSGDFNELT